MENDDYVRSVSMIDHPIDGERVAVYLPLTNETRVLLSAPVQKSP